MSDHLEIVLTNDDGIDSPGLRALYDALADVGDVTVVAPANDQSAVGRSISSEAALREHALGYALEGTPTDCVVAAMGDLVPDPDLVVAGCNHGANLGEYALGRSGTVSAAVEATFFGVPAIASSLYVPVDAYGDTALTRTDFREAVRATRYLVDRAQRTDVFDRAAYLNVNAPVPDGDPAPIELTRPSRRYEMDATLDGDSVSLQDRIWERMDPETLPDPEGTDRRAVVEGRVSVSPLRVPQATVDHDGLEPILEDYLERDGTPSGQ